MRLFFKGLQVVLLAGAGAVLADPQLMTQVVPKEHQTKAVAIGTILSAVLPSIAPRVVRKWWGGGQTPTGEK